jgi:hypothetical protein
MLVETAVNDALLAGSALCKFISRNDVGVTGGHQCGFYLPKSVWQMFAKKGPIKGENHKSQVTITWPDKIKTHSVVTWYGVGTRSEYRLTSFQRNFPWLHESFVGCLLVLVPFNLDEFRAHILETDDEIETLRAALGVEMFGGWGVYAGGKAKTETENECLNRVFTETIQPLDDFPSGFWMAEKARTAVEECSAGNKLLGADARLLSWISAEYQLFRTLERKVSLPSIQKSFQTVDDFINVAATVMNRRKSRAGHSLEHHVEQLLKVSGLPFDRQPRIDGKVRPDLLIPGKAAYEDAKFPAENLIVAGLKTTCKDRWRQILNEGKRVPEKHLVTLQEAISSDQLREMHEANVTLVVPKPYHKGYDTNTGIRLLSVEDFITKAKAVTNLKAA